jgi:hypothetical protein
MTFAMSRAQLKATGIHEVGNAVMAYLQRVPFRRVSIVPEKDTLDHVLLSKWPE